MQKIVLPHVLALKRQYRRELAKLRKASTDFTPGADDRFRAIKAKADSLREKIYFADQAEQRQ